MKALLAGFHIDADTVPLLAEGIAVITVVKVDAVPLAEAGDVTNSPLISIESQLTAAGDLSRLQDPEREGPLNFTRISGSG